MINIVIRKEERDFKEVKVMIKNHLKVQNTQIIMNII
ncbi:Uncharacterised protein [uncultured Clostridium sp.]|nr:Uncharacterised protein [uncultured Clostridium sp.]